MFDSFLRGANACSTETEVIRPLQPDMAHASDMKLLRRRRPRDAAIAQPNFRQDTTCVGNPCSRLTGCTRLFVSQRAVNDVCLASSMKKQRHAVMPVFLPG